VERSTATRSPVPGDAVRSEGEHDVRALLGQDTATRSVSSPSTLVEPAVGVTEPLLPIRDPAEHLPRAPVPATPYASSSGVRDHCGECSPCASRDRHCFLLAANGGAATSGGSAAWSTVAGLTFDFKYRGRLLDRVEAGSRRCAHLHDATNFKLTGLPASTLRYYESIGVIAPISRDTSSRHRVYDEEDLDRLMAVACLAATGMSVSDMRRYVANAAIGAAAAGEQVGLLAAQEQRLAVEAEHIALRQRYVRLKIDYWHAVETGDPARADELAARARALADGLKRPQQH
jgi:DNA-binding transcriptional MerR regulator